MFLTVKSILKENMEPASYLLLYLPSWLTHISENLCSKSVGSLTTFTSFNNIYLFSTCTHYQALNSELFSLCLENLLNFVSW